MATARIGDIVIYRMALYDNHWAHGAGTLVGGEHGDHPSVDPVAPGTQVAAIVCAVHDDGSVNLRVINDGHGDLPWIERIPNGSDPGTWSARP